MTLNQLRSIVEIAERQHVTRADEALNIVQSAVSAAVSGLEGRQAVKLFHWVGCGIELTKTGHSFLGEARAVLARAETAELLLADLRGPAAGFCASTRVKPSPVTACHVTSPHFGPHIRKSR